MESNSSLKQIINHWWGFSRINVDSIENIRMLTMVLSTVEFNFVIIHFPGVRNVLADFGSRILNASEWDEPNEDDPLDIIEFYNFESLINFSKFTLNDFSPSENEQVQRVAATPHQVEDDFLKAMVNTVWYN